jgi:hypothetical protein
VLLVLGNLINSLISALQKEYPNMAETWNGFGTKFYGSKDQYPDGSFITTEWIVILLIPVIPIGSMRVFYKGTSYEFRRTTSRYLVIQKLSLDWRQVFSTYFVTFMTLVVAYSLWRFATNLFINTDGYYPAGLIAFFTPILIAYLLFFKSKPSRNTSKPLSPQNDVKLSQISKPKITPPSSLPDPDLTLLNPLIIKYEPVLDKMMGDLGGKPLEWIEIKRGLDDVILLNYKSISHYMDKEVYRHSIEKKQNWEEQINTATTLATTCAWMIGKEWGQKDFGLRTKLCNKKTIDITDIPFDAMQLLATAVYMPYFLFAGGFTEYYNSAYGKNVRNQKEGHFADIYQGMMRGVLACFLMGVKS